MGSTASAPSPADTDQLAPLPYRSAEPITPERLAAEKDPAAKAALKRRRALEFPPAPEPLPEPVMDNHTHLDFPVLDDNAPADLRDALARVSLKDALDVAASVGVQGAVQVGCDLESSRFVVQAVKADERLLGAVAIHPNDAPALAEAGQLDAALAELEVLAAHPRVRAIGETGLDYFRTEAQRQPQQQESFRKHLELAKRLDLALQIHDRDAHEDVVRILLEQGAPSRVVFHCFSGDASLARICREHGWYLSFSGTVTFKNSEGLREAAALADPSLILVETDAPFLTPHPFRGRPNASYLMPQTVRVLAETRETELSRFCQQLSRNTEQVYGSWD
ncbi:TatD family hydrolase [Psychromicrobium xiongbiense]|uniref:TatD family hydrolase n=1 Tax=Psychromicrobium xiongbiense TaxID=3051184 RepID=UPI003B21292D